MSADELYFLLRRCDYLRAPTVVLSAKDIPEVNLSLSHWCVTIPFKTSVSLVKVPSVKTFPVKWPLDKLSLLYLPPLQWPDWQYFW